MASEADNSSALIFLKAMDQPEELPPSKRPKTKTLNSPSPSKGKSKIQETESIAIDSDLSVCGICLSEEGDKAIRGWIDSCNHYFCFVCIMEWAKVESRCPLCKRRFNNICRPPKEGIFHSERVVTVPVRDQIYDHLGNATTGPTEPYSEVKCSVCHNAEDESLLLLCDLCDSASHTYCVGLGATVPEGDWFCHECTLLRAEHSKNEEVTGCDSQSSFHGFHRTQSTESYISILDIVRESNVAEEVRTSTMPPLQRNQFSSDVIPAGGFISTVNTMRRGTIAANPTTICARTLLRCRNVHDRIRALRENWNAIRSGSLSFSSKSADHGFNPDQKYKTSALPDRSNQLISVSCSRLPLASEKGSSGNKLQKKNSHDIDKVWKMMEVAKSIKQDHEKKNIVQHASRKINDQKETKNMRSSVLISPGLQNGPKNFVSAESMKHCQYEKGLGMARTQMFGKQKEGRASMKKISNVGQVFPTTHSPAHSRSPSSTKLGTSFLVNVSCGTSEHLPQENLPGTPAGLATETDSFACPISLVESIPIESSNISHAKVECDGSSSFYRVERTRQKGLMETSINGEAERNKDAKTEIQALVKLNLKLLSRDNKLGVNVFKEVARLATHTILAACDLEPPRLGTRSLPNSICCHADEDGKFRRSTLMRSSCRECFYLFVKDVVSTIMVEQMV